MHKTVDEVISTWTPEEREQFKELIEECRKREIKIDTNEKLSLKGLRRIRDNAIGVIIENSVKDWVNE